MRVGCYAVTKGESNLNANSTRIILFGLTFLLSAASFRYMPPLAIHTHRTRVNKAQQTSKDRARFNAVVLPVIDTGLVYWARQIDQRGHHGYADPLVHR